MYRIWMVLAVFLPFLARAETVPQGAPPVAVLIPNAPGTTQYDPNSGFPDKNGPFSAMMVVIPQAELGEFEKDDGGARHIDRVSRAEAGALLAVKVIFVGLMPDWNGNANITYDLQVYGPDGQIYAGSDYRSLDALHARVAGDGSGVFDNRGKIVIMQFEDQDAPGVYTLKSTLHDNVAKRDIPLMTTVELLAKASGPVASDSQAVILPPEVTTALNGDAEPKAVQANAKKSKKRRRRHH